MLKKTITYTDFNGVERTEDFYFNLSKTEVLEMEMSVPGGLHEKLEEMVSSKNLNELRIFIMELIGKAYGKKSDDGRLFLKNDEITKELLQNAAFDDFVFNLLTKEGEIEAFVKGIFPSEYLKA